MLAVTLAVDIFLGVCAFFGLNYLGELGGLLSFVAAMTFVVGFGAMAMFLFSGDLPALYEIFRDSRVSIFKAKKAYGLAETFIVRVLAPHAEAQRMDAEARLLEAQNEENSIRLALMDRAEKQDSMNQLETFEKPPNTYTSALPEPDPTYQAIIRWVQDGLKYDPKTGRITERVPWGKTGELVPSEAKRAKEWIATVNAKSSRGWLFKYENNVWYLNTAYTSTFQVVEELRRVPLLKG
jgi:hypothetical protein